MDKDILYNDGMCVNLLKEDTLHAIFSFRKTSLSPGLDGEFQSFQ